MPIMTRMRDSMPIILFGLLIAFLITIVFEWGMDYLGMRTGSGSDVVGRINGRKVTYQEFSEMVQTYAENQKAQSGTELDEEQLKQVREQIWQSLVQEELLKEQTAKLGLKVTDQELVDWVRGDNPPEDLKRNFVDSTGQFRRDVYDQFLADPNQFIRDPKGADPAYGSKWLKRFEENLRQRRIRDKLQSLVGASVIVSEGEIRQRFDEQNDRLNAAYAFFDPNVLVKDEEARPTEADLKEYYEEHLDQYKFEASRTLKYILIPEKPSASDTAMRIKDMDDVVAKLRAGADFLGLVFTYAEKPDSGAFFRHGELTPALEAAAFAAKVGDVVGPIREPDGLRIVKVLGERKGAGEYVRASHILLPMDGDTAAVKALAANLARDLKQGTDFAAAARVGSKDATTAAQGGDLGWFTKGRMVPAFENAVMKGKIGEVVGPVRTQFGLHIIKVTGRDSRELKLVQIQMKITTSAQTKNDLFERARDFAYAAKDADFAKSAQEAGFEALETQIQEKGGVIPGVGYSEALIRWSFKHSSGAVSDVFTFPSGYLVAAVIDAKEAGVRPFAEVQESMKPIVLRKIKSDKAVAIAAGHREKLGATDSLQKLTAIAPQAVVAETGPFSVTGVIPGIGRDPVFSGTAAGLTVGQVSKAFQGQRGAFIVQLLSRTQPDTIAYKAQREMLRTRLLQDKRSRFAAEWIERLKEHADIEDNRENFFR
jgi:peptidyl-prolyl cis-trans isomerase D